MNSLFNTIVIFSVGFSLQTLAQINPITAFSGSLSAPVLWDGALSSSLAGSENFLLKKLSMQTNSPKMIAKLVNDIKNENYSYSRNPLIKEILSNGAFEIEGHLDDEGGLVTEDFTKTQPQLVRFKFNIDEQEISIRAVRKRGRDYGASVSKEYLSYLCSEVFGFNLVPLTVLREGNGVISSLQLFIENKKKLTDKLLQSELIKKQLAMQMIFDLIIENIDRGTPQIPHNYLLSSKNDIISIDHEFTFGFYPIDFAIKKNLSEHSKHHDDRLNEFDQNLIDINILLIKDFLTNYPRLSQNIFDNLQDHSKLHHLKTQIAHFLGTDISLKFSARVKAMLSFLNGINRAFKKNIKAQTENIIKKAAQRESSAFSKLVIDILEQKNIIDKRKFLKEHPNVFLVSLESGFEERPLNAIMKTQDSRQNPHNEVLAFLISEQFGFNLVPPTVLRNIDNNPYSLQLFVNPGEVRDKAKPTLLQEILGRNRINAQLGKQKIFDLIINNTDRYYKNSLFLSNNTINSIDHGSSFEYRSDDIQDILTMSISGDQYPKDLSKSLSNIITFINSNNQEYIKIKQRLKYFIKNTDLLSVLAYKYLKEDMVARLIMRINSILKMLSNLEKIPENAVVKNAEMSNLLQEAFKDEYSILEQHREIKKDKTNEERLENLFNDVMGQGL